VWRWGAVAAAAAALAAPAHAAAQLPFDLTEADLSRVDTAAVRWIAVRTYVGGAEAALSYASDDVTPGECKAAAVLALLRLYRHYQARQEEPPVSMQMSFTCGGLYEGDVDYDGLVVRLVLRDDTTGALIYEGRWRRFP
jgi:hypothetical protein